MSRIRIITLFLLIITAGVLAASDNNPSSADQPDITTLLASRDASLAELHTRLEAASNEVEALEILHAIQAHKLETEVAILRLQKRQAELAGNQEAVAVIETAIERLLEPPAPLGNDEARAASARRQAEGQSHD